MISRKAQAPRAAFTLVEMMISLGIGALILGAVISTTVGTQKVFAAADQYYAATSDQMRVLDSIAADMRGATSGGVSNNGQLLTLNLPDYLDPAQNPPAPRTPSISATGTVTYGASASQPTVTYSISGTAPKQIVQRVFTNSSGGVVTTTLTAVAANYQLSFFDPANPGGTAPFSLGGRGQPSSMTAQITFAPRFNRLNTAGSRQGTIVSSTMLMRNHQ